MAVPAVIGRTSNPATPNPNPNPPDPIPDPNPDPSPSPSPDPDPSPNQVIYLVMNLLGFLSLGEAWARAWA